MNLTMQITNPESITVRPVVLSTQRKASKRVQLFFRQTFQLLLVALLAVASYLAISHFFLQSVRVVGRSMVPTLYDSQHYLLNRWIFHVRPPQQGDIVVLRDPSDNGFSVKRVIATWDDAAPALDLPEIIYQTAEGRQRELILRDFSDAAVSQLRAAGAVDVQVQDCSLEDIFVAFVRPQLAAAQ